MIPIASPPFRQAWVGNLRGLAPSSASSLSPVAITTSTVTWRRSRCYIWTPGRALSGFLARAFTTLSGRPSWSSLEARSFSPEAQVSWNFRIWNLPHIQVLSFFNNISQFEALRKKWFVFICVIWLAYFVWFVMNFATSTRADKQFTYTVEWG